MASLEDVSNGGNTATGLDPGLRMALDGARSYGRSMA
jgi:hypothetical protein